jgi:trans-aconitate methyltransferase
LNAATGREWNAREYHRLSDPQFRWGLSVLERLPLRGDETVLDAGCGSGRVTERLLERLPRGRVIAADVSRNMLAEARALLEPRFGDRVRIVELDLQDFELDTPVDVVFSTAALHWVKDHPKLFRMLHRALVPGGRLHAQCGGGPNVARLKGRAAALTLRSEFARHFEAFVTPFARLQGITATQNGFTETGAQSLNLTIAQQTTNSLRSVLGAQLGGALNVGLPSKLAAQLRLGWAHEYADTSRPVNASFAGAPTVPFTTFGASPQRDGVILGVAASTAVAEAINVYVRYEGEIAGQDSSHALIAGLRMTW